ncbi:MAG: hypothetical protein WBA88_09280, partial [Pseudaminobacter sp.]
RVRGCFRQKTERLWAMDCSLIVTPKAQGSFGYSPRVKKNASLLCLTALEYPVLQCGFDLPTDPPLNVCKCGVDGFNQFLFGIVFQ